MPSARSKLWIDSLVLGFVGVLLIFSLYVYDWFTLVLGAPASTAALGREEVGLVLGYLSLVTIYLIVRSVRTRLLIDASVSSPSQEARSNALLVEEFLHKLGGPEAAQAFIKSCLDQAHLISGGSGSAIHLVEGDELLYTYAGGTPPPNLGKENIQRSVAGEAVRANKPVVVVDAHSDPRMAGALPGQIPYRSLLVVPITYGTRVLGTLRLIHPEDRRFNERTGEALRALTLLMAAALWRANDVDEKTSLMRERAAATARAEDIERRFDALAARVDRGLILTDANREKVFWVNDRAAQVTGRSVDALLANPRNVLEAVHAEDRPRIEAELAKAGASSSSLEYRIQRGNATTWVREERVPIKDNKGQVTGILSILAEETRARQIEQEFETVQRRLGFPLEDAPLVFYALSPGGNYGMNFVSPNVEKVLGHRSGDFLADPVFWTAQLHPDEQARVFGEFPALFQKGTLRHSYRFKHADGSYRILEDVMTLVRTPDGKPVEIVGTWMDITERVRLQEGVNYSLNRIKELQDSRTRLLNTISHDLANPITPIRLQLALLQPALKDTPQARNLDVVSRNIEIVNRLIQDLKDVARLEAGKLKVDPVPGEIMTVVQSAVDSFQGAAIAKGIVLSAKLAKPQTLPFDEQRITQVLFNFLSNAMKFTPDKGEITVHALTDRNALTVRVTDSGRGLSSDEIDRLFKPFSQVHDRTEIKEKGTGLGLYICKGLIESHGGRVFVESPGRGRGSTFGFTLPLAGLPTEGPATAAMSSALPTPGAGAPEPESSAPRPRKPRTPRAKKPPTGENGPAAEANDDDSKPRTRKPKISGP